MQTPRLASTLLFALSLTASAEPAISGERVRLRGSLDNSRAKFEQGKRGRVAFMGGSITEMDGYRPMVSDILKKRFPETAFDFVNAGIASTCSTTGAFRFASEVLAGGAPDLLFVEFAVNDDQDAAHTRTECVRGLEGIVRQALRANPEMDIVVTYFVNEGMLKTLQDGGTPLPVDAHEAVAKHYALSTIHLGSEVAAEITDGKLTWQQYGGTHPAPFGNALAARMIDELFTRAWAAPIAEAVALPPPLDPLNYEAGRFLDPKLAQSKSGWTLDVPDWKSLAGDKRSRFTSIPIFSATEPGAEATLEFEGTAVGAYLVAGPDAGIVEASVDGAAPRAVNLFHNHSRGLHYPRTVMFGTDLAPGKHSLTIRIAADTKSAGHAARIMQFVAN